MIVYRVEYGTPLAGHCSVCYRLLEVELASGEALDSAKERLAALFEQHVCGEDSGLAALRVVRDNENK